MPLEIERKGMEQHGTVHTVHMAASAAVPVLHIVWHEESQQRGQEESISGDTVSAGEKTLKEWKSKCDPWQSGALVTQ